MTLPHRSFKNLVWLAILALCQAAMGETLLDVSSSLSASDPTQPGRLSRNTIPSFWAAPKTFPGVANTSSFHYHVFEIPAVQAASATNFQISVNDSNTAVFVSAYDGTYSPASSFSNNYVGDLGGSGNLYGNTAYFQVALPAGHDLLVIVNDVGSGVGSPFHLTVEGFTDTEFSDPPGVRLDRLSLSGANLVFKGTNSLLAASYNLLQSTNLTLPLASWTSIETNNIAGETNFTFTVTNAVSGALPKKFYTLQLR